MSSHPDSPPPPPPDIDKAKPHPSPPTTPPTNGSLQNGSGGLAPQQLSSSPSASSSAHSRTENPSGSTVSDDKEKEKLVDKDKDKGSLTTTLNTSNTHPNTTNTTSSSSSNSNPAQPAKPRTRRFSRRNKPASSVEKSATSSSAPAKPTTLATPATSKSSKSSVRSNSRPIPSAPKSSFLSKLVRKLVPCVGPSASHPIDALRPPATVGAAAGTSNDVDASSAVSGPTLDDLSAAEKEKMAQDPVDKPSQDKELESKEKDNEKASVHEGQSTPAVIVIPPAPTAPPPSADVLLPPTPTKAILPSSETGGVLSGAVQAPGSTGSDIFSASPSSSTGTGAARRHSHATGSETDTSYTDDEGTGGGEDGGEEGAEGDGEGGEEGMDEDDEDMLIMSGGAGIPIGPDGVPRPLLPPIAPQHAGRKCLVLDLDETLVHSSFKSIQHADYVVPVEIEYHWHNVYVIKRPGVDNFLKKMGELYEVVVFTASLSKYADPVLDKLDIHQVVTHRLFRESCYNHKGNYVKDLSQLGRPIADTIILDNSPASYIFHPNNAVPVSSWFNDPHDTELTDLCPFLADLGGVGDVRGVLDGGM